MQSTPSIKPFDILVLGATGFTGSLISKYLCEHYSDTEIKTAFAGRNLQKGQALLDKLGIDHTRWVTVDIFNEKSLHAAVNQAKVVINAAGPFAEYGPPVVAACLASGTHYLDITGEPSFFHEMRTTHHAKAKDLGISIIHACGFDSIPADLGVRALVDRFEKKENITVEAFLKTNAQFSGGTWTTAIKAIDRQRKGGKKRVKRERDNVRKMPLKIHFNKKIDRWAMPMPVLDPHIVKTSARELKDVYGSQFAYGQYFTIKTWWKMAKLVMGIGSLFVLTRFKWGLNYLLNRNKPGTGPSEAKRNQSFFRFDFFGNNGHQQEHLIIQAGDPGYIETAKMISEAALMQLQRDKEGYHMPGVVTPSMAFGTKLLDRLVECGFEVD